MVCARVHTLLPSELPIIAPRPSSHGQKTMASRSLCLLALGVLALALLLAPTGAEAKSLGQPFGGTFSGLGPSAGPKGGTGGQAAIQVKSELKRKMPAPVDDDDLEEDGDLLDEEVRPPEGGGGATGACGAAAGCRMPTRGLTSR